MWQRLASHSLQACNGFHVAGLEGQEELTLINPNTPKNLNTSAAPKTHKLAISQTFSFRYSSSSLPTLSPQGTNILALNTFV